MKTKIWKILGVVASIAMVLSLAVTAVPVAAAGPGTNAWGKVTLPAVLPDSSVGPVAIAPDGTVYAAVFYYDGTDWVRDLQKSTDGGFTFTQTSLAGLDNDITDIVISPKYASDKTLYVSTEAGDVYRVTNAGANNTLLIPIVDSYGTVAEAVYDLDVWNDGTKNWIAAATDIDVLVIKDQLFESWRDFELATEGDETYAYAVAFDPQFSSSELLWAVIEDPVDGLFRLTATQSPGQWGMLVSDVHPFVNAYGDDVSAYPVCDIAFPDEYDWHSPVLYVGLGDDDNSGNLFLVNAGLVPDESEALPLFDTDIDILSVEVSGGTILAGAYLCNTVFYSEDAGSTFDVVGLDPWDYGDFSGKGPTGQWATRVYMSPNFETSGLVYAATRGSESALSRSSDGGLTYNQIGLINTTIDEVVDLAFSPAAGSHEALLITWSEENDSYSLWKTADVTAASPVWERVLCGADGSGYGNIYAYFWMVRYAQNTPNTVVLSGIDPGPTLWKSTDGAQSFKFWRHVTVDITDMEVVDGSTLYAATNNGFFGLRALGTPLYGLTGIPLNSIALSPSFATDGTIIVGDDDGNVYISTDKGVSWGAPQDVGSGNVWVAFDAQYATNKTIYAATEDGDLVSAVVSGKVFTTAGATAVEDASENIPNVGEGGFNGIVVAPDNTLYVSGVWSEEPVTPAYATTISGTVNLLGADSGATATGTIATEDVTIISGAGFTDGEAVNVIAATLHALSSDVVQGTIYFKGATSLTVGSITLTFIDGVNLTVTSGEFTAAPPIGEDVTVSGFALTADVTALPAPGVPPQEKMWRLLLGEPENAWEATPELDEMWGLSYCAGSNILWTVVDANSLYAFNDLLSGRVVLSGASNITETSATITWNVLDNATKYGYKVLSGTTVVSSGTATPATGATTVSVNLTGLTQNTAYTWQVRAVDPYDSRWSAAGSFSTKELVTPPIYSGNLRPEHGATGIPVLPSFAWDAMTGAANYKLQLSTAADFSTLLYDVTIPGSQNYWVPPESLDYETRYYWRVASVGSTGVQSAWVTSVFTTEAEPLPPVTVTLPPVTNTVTQTVTPPAQTVIITTPGPAVTVTQPAQTIQPAETPTYVWAIVGVGAVLVIAIIVLIVRTRRVA